MPMKDKPTDTTAAPADPPALLIYEITTPGPLKIGSVLAYVGGQVRMTKEHADALNTAQPGSVRFLGI